MATMSFHTANQTLRQLLGNSLSYCVPRFQRDDSWEEDAWDDLWQDILGTLPPGGEPAHYRDLGNSPFTSKRQAYQASEFAMTRQLAAENAEWNAERIAARQQHMARLATAIWRIDQLS